jgi:hypothetical protein
MKKHAPKTPQKMTFRELEEATRDLDDEFVIDSFGPMSPGARRAWERARKRSRKDTGPRARTVSVTIDRELLRRADRLARELNVSRSRLLATGLESVVHASERLSGRGASKRRKSKSAA